MNEFLKNKKNIINLLILGILILALPLGVNLVQKQQILKGKAISGAEGLEFVEEPGILERRGNIFVLKAEAQGKIKLKLTSPLGPPGTITTDNSTSVHLPGVSLDSARDKKAHLEGGRTDSFQVIAGKE